MYAGPILILVMLFRLLMDRKSSTSSSPSVRRGFVLAGARLVVILLTSALAGKWLWLSGFLYTLLFPSFWLNQVTVRFGWVKASYWFARFSFPFGFDESARAVGAYYGARALLRSPERKHLGWIEAELARPKVLAGAGVVALGICQWLRGNDEVGKKLLLLASRLPPTFTGRAACKVSRDLLVADAAEHGDFELVIELGRAPRPTRWSYVMARAAERLLETPRSPSKLGLTCLFLLAPRRIATWPLIRRALQTELSPFAPPQALGLESWPSALAHLWSALSKPHLEVDELRRKLATVRNVLHSTIHQDTLTHRCFELSAGSASVATERFEAQLVTLLVEVLNDPKVSLRAQLNAWSDNYLDAALLERREALFEEVQVAADDFRAKTGKDILLDAKLEWLAWAKFSHLADELLHIDPESSHEVFEATFVPLCNFAVQEQNERKRSAFAWSVYSWLSGQAEPGENADLLKSNLKSTLK